MSPIVYCFFALGRLGVKKDSAEKRVDDQKSTSTRRFFWRPSFVVLAALG